jgi:hypothetical protein
LIEALLPFTASGGTAEAYVRTTAEPDINATTTEYVEHYVPAHSGDNYMAHVTVGLAKLDDLLPHPCRRSLPGSPTLPRP